MANARKWVTGPSEFPQYEPYSLRERENQGTDPCELFNVRSWTEGRTHVNCSIANSLLRKGHGPWEGINVTKTCRHFQIFERMVVY